MATEHLHKVDEVGPQAFGVVVLRVLQAPSASLVVEAGGCLVDGPAALLFLVVLASFDVATEVRVFRQSGGHGLRQIQLLDVLRLHEDDDMHVDPAGAVVVLRGCLASAILILEPQEEVQATDLSLLVKNTEDVALPRFVPMSPRSPQQQAFHSLDHDVHYVQRLRHRQEEALLEHLLHLVADPLVVGEAPFVGGDGEEDARVADLPHHV